MPEPETTSGLTPLVSVLIPTYNRIDTMRRALASVLEQTFQDFEIVVIDDGSTDPIVSLAGEFAKTRVVVHPANRGISEARNTGVSAAAGKYIAYLDSDDAWLPHKLEKQVQYLEAHPDIAACVCGYRYFTEEGDSVEIPRLPENQYAFMAQGISFAPGTTLMARTEVMKSLPYDSRFPRLVDLDWGLRFARHHRLGVVPDVLAVVYRDSRPSAAKMETANTLIIAKHGQDMMALGKSFGSRCIAKRWLEVATHYHREGNRAKGNAYLWKSIRTNPFQRPSMYMRILGYWLGIDIIGFIKRTRKKLFWRNLER